MNEDFLCFQGCRNEFEGCEKWKTAGYCVKFPDFMQFNCRETCGTCGFLSRKSGYSYQWYGLMGTTSWSSLANSNHVNIFDSSK